MSKIRELIKVFGTGVFGIVYFVVSIAISLAIMYFGIKFVMSTGDKIFNKDKNNQEVMTPANSTDIRIAKDNKELRDNYIKDCMQQGGINEVSCGCIYNGLWVEYSVDDIKQIITTQKYTDSQLEIQRKIFTNCGTDVNYYS